VGAALSLCGAAIGKQTEAEALVADMQATFADIRAKSPQTGKTVYFEISPLQWGLWSAGNSTFMHELAEMCGVTNIFADLTGFSAVSEEQVLALNPDYIVLMNGMGETSVEEILARGHWADVTAVKNGAIYNDVSSIMTRPAPRLKDAALALYNLVSGTAE
jgi:iron complex transport system substrate-binding protein